MANGRKGVDADQAHRTRPKGDFSPKASSISAPDFRARIGNLTPLQKAGGLLVVVAGLAGVGYGLRDEPAQKQTPIEQLKGVKESPGVKIFKELIQQDPNSELTARGKVESLTSDMELSLSPEFKERLLKATKGKASDLNDFQVKKLTEQFQKIYELHELLIKSTSVPKDLNDFEDSKVSDFDRAQLDAMAEELNDSGVKNPNLPFDGSRGSVVAQLKGFDTDISDALKTLGIDLGAIGQSGPQVSR